MSEKNGGSAFPVHEIQSEYRDGRYHDVWRPQDGMSLRDWFAGQALSGLLAAEAHEQAIGYTPDRATEMAGKAYGLADAMLKAREASRIDGKERHA